MKGVKCQGMNLILMTFQYRHLNQTNKNLIFWMERWECRSNVGVLLLDQFEFTPFKGKTIVVVRMHIPTTTIVLL